MKRLSPTAAVMVAAAFVAGFSVHLLYRRWLSPPPGILDKSADAARHTPQGSTEELRSYPVTHAPLLPPTPGLPELPLLQSREVEKIRGLAGSRARIRGRIFRVGHAAKSNTYFLNFGPSRSSFAGVIFASGVELFERNKVSPKSFEGREVEMHGEIRDHPQYGLEMILENPSQIKLLD